MVPPLILISPHESPTLQPMAADRSPPCAFAMPPLMVMEPPRAVMVRPDASDELGAFGGNRPAADGDGLARRDRCASTRLTERFDSASGNNELSCSNAITARYSRMSENRAARYRDGRVRLSQDARLTTCACSHGIQGSLPLMVRDEVPRTATPGDASNLWPHM